MVKRSICRVVFVLFILSAAGCSSRITETSEKGLFHVDMFYREEAKVGRNVAELKIRDAEGRPLEGAAIEVTPWMPEMGHGVRYEPKVTEKGGGTYNIVFHFTMPGLWELRMVIRKGDVEDRVVFQFPDIPEVKGE